MGRRGPPKGEGGAPRKEINIDVARRAASIGCTADEIAALLGIARATFYLVLSRLAPDLRSWQHGIGPGLAGSAPASQRRVVCRSRPGRPRGHPELRGRRRPPARLPCPLRMRRWHPVG